MMMASREKVVGEAVEGDRRISHCRSCWASQSRKNSTLRSVLSISPRLRVEGERALGVEGGREHRKKGNRKKKAKAKKKEHVQGKRMERPALQVVILAAIPHQGLVENEGSLPKIFERGLGVVRDQAIAAHLVLVLKQGVALQAVRCGCVS